MKKQCLRPGRIYVAKYYPGKPLPQVPHADCKNVLIHVKEALPSRQCPEHPDESLAARQYHLDPPGRGTLGW
jgi:hypothetical protein